jgi:predicted MFS family arabinose efflux permease
MVFFGYLLLPLGKTVTARVGAARSYSVFWLARNAAALLVSLAAVAGLSGMSRTATALLLTGAFFFYGFRAAGVAMSQPLLGNITTEQDRSRVIGLNSGFFYASCLASLVAISLLLRFRDGLETLAGIVAVGATLGFTASYFINRMDETESIRDAARKPLRGEFREILRDRTLLWQLAAGFAINLSIIMLVPISMLALKRGYGISDTQALLFALVQFGTGAAASFLSGKIDSRIGSRRTLLYAFLLLAAIGPVWALAPDGLHPAYMALPFLMAGATGIVTLNARIHYFLQTIPESRQVAGSMLIWVVTGAGAGMIGMLLSGVLIDATARINPVGSQLPGYRLYFGLASLLLIGGVWVILRLPLLPFEKQPAQKLP